MTERDLEEIEARIADAANGQFGRIDGARLVGELRRTREALRKYGVHLEGCPLPCHPKARPFNECLCGLDAALEERPMAIQTPTELRERIHDLCRQHKWDQAEYEIEARDDAIRAEEVAKHRGEIEAVIGKHDEAIRAEERARAVDVVREAWVDAQDTDFDLGAETMREKCLAMLRARAPSPAQRLAPAAGERSEETGDE